MDPIKPSTACKSFESDSRPVAITGASERFRIAGTLPPPVSMVRQSRREESSGDHILIVDDCDDDVLLTERAITRAGLVGSMVRACDGVEALELLRRKIDDGAPLPRVILLDLHLPRRSGMEVLHELRTDPCTAELPVIVLTGCEEAESRLAKDGPPGVSFLRKPVRISALVDLAAQLRLGILVPRAA